MTTRIDLYTRLTNALIADLEKGVRPWLKPWNAEHAAGRITRPLRAGGHLLADYDETDGPEGEAYREALAAITEASGRAA